MVARLIAGHFIAQTAPSSVQTRLQIALSVVLHCRQASYLGKQHVSFARGPPSTRAQMINLIQPCIAELRLNPVMPQCFVAIETVHFPPSPPSLALLILSVECDEKSYASLPHIACNRSNTLIIDHVSVCQNEYGGEMSDLPQLNERYMEICFSPEAAEQQHELVCGIKECLLLFPQPLLAGFRARRLSETPTFHHSKAGGFGGR